MSTNSYFKFILIGFIIVSLKPHIIAKTRIFAYIIGPGVSKHFEPSAPNLNEFHPGVGGEFQLSLNRWVLGFHGYYMIEDSHYDEAFWMGATVGYRIGKRSNLWFEPTLIIGGMKKRDYRSGEFSFIALPILSAGYKFIGFNLSYTPKISDISKPILFFQIKIRIL